MLKLDPSKVSQAYSGKAGKCCCGCAGKHYHRTEGKNATRQIARIVGLIQDAMDANDSSVMIEPAFASCIIGGRLYCAYL